MIERIAILGGSSVYTPEFIMSVVSHNLNVKEIVLIGRPGNKLPLVARFCQRLLDRSGFPAKVTPTANVEEGVAGAKYVLNHIRVGGMKARVRDEKLPPKMGMVGHECLGAGGFANALRTTPVTLDLARRIEQVNPGALFINLTNPVGIVAEALIKYSNLKVIGICDMPGKYIRKVAELLHVDPAELWVDFVGLNHMGWIQDVKIEGRSVMGPLLDRLERGVENGFDCEVMDLFRMLPTQELNLYFHQREALERQRACPRFRAEILHEAEKQILKLYQDPSLTEIPELTRRRNARWYEETIVPVIMSLESKTEREHILCVRNGGSIRDLPEDCSVEVPVKVSRRGIKARAVGNCPRFLKGLFTTVKESDRLTVEAVRHRSYEYALQALCINPFVPSLKTAKRFLDRIMKEENIELH